jgi:hypothetical protein
MKGQLAPVKYLFEVTGLFPKTEETEAQPEGDSLALTLLNHMGISVNPLDAADTANAGDAEAKTKEKKSPDPTAQADSGKVNGKAREEDEATKHS